MFMDKFIIEQETSRIVSKSELKKILNGFYSEAGSSPLSGEKFILYGPVVSNTESSAKLELNKLDKTKQPFAQKWFFYKRNDKMLSAYKIVLHDTINEAMREKEMYGRGIEHGIFSSSKKPNVLFKVGENEVVDEWVDIFKESPDIFPVIYKVGRMPGMKHKYVEIEKLNTRDFELKWDKLENDLEELGIVDVDRGESFTDIYTNYGSDAEHFKEIASSLKNHNTDSLNFFIDILRLIKQAEKVQLDVTGRDTFVDAHKYNFGYDSKNNLKILDI